MNYENLTRKEEAALIPSWVKVVSSIKWDHGDGDPLFSVEYDHQVVLLVIGLPNMAKKYLGELRIPSASMCDLIPAFEFFRQMKYLPRTMFDTNYVDTDWERMEKAREKRKRKGNSSN